MHQIQIKSGQGWREKKLGQGMEEAVTASVVLHSKNQTRAQVKGLLCCSCCWTLGCCLRYSLASSEFLFQGNTKPNEGCPTQARGAGVVSQLLTEPRCGMLRGEPGLGQLIGGMMAKQRQGVRMRRLGGMRKPGSLGRKRWPLLVRVGVVREGHRTKPVLEGQRGSGPAGGQAEGACDRSAAFPSSSCLCFNSLHS